MKSDPRAPPLSAWSRLKRHFTEAFSGELLAPKKIDDTQRPSEWLQSRSRNAYRYILAVVAAVLLPVILFNVYSAEWVMASGTSAMLLAVLANILLLNTKRSAAAAPLPVLLMCIALVILGFYREQSYALVLLYPLLVLLPVLLRLRVAITVGILAGIAIAPKVLQMYEPMAVFVVALSLVLTWVISAWLMFAMREQARRLRGMAITDPLTGVYNRRYMELQAARALQAWQRYNNSVSMLLVDIDHFKRINDKFGHSMGDKALIDVAERIGERVRKTDVLCRFGGEEFVLLLDDVTGDKAARLAEELRYAVEISCALPESTMTISVGVCDVSIAKSVEHWFKLADNALYVAKNKGRNRVEIAREKPAKVIPISKSVPDWR